MANNLVANNTIKTICSNINKSDNKPYVFYGGFNSPWSSYTPDGSPTSYNYVFNYSDDKQTKITLTGAATFSSINSINNSVNDSTTQKTYICGSFTLSSPSATNIAFLQNTAWTSLGLTFTANSVVNCMVFNSNKTLLYIGGIFTSVTKTNTSAANFAIIDVSNYTVTAAASAPTPPNCTEINSLIIVGTTIYAGGKNGNNLFFSSYNTSTSTWTSLLTQTAGSINIIYNIPNTTILVIGGQFTTIGTATSCNNIVLYNITGATWAFLGTAVGSYGVTGVGTTLPTGITAPVVYTVTTEISAAVRYIYIGGYFKNAGGILCNSIVIYNYTTPGWIVYNPTLSSTTTTDIGVYFNNSTDATPTTTEPGIVYNLVIVPSDNLNVVASGQFYINTKTTSSTKPTKIFNLFKITIGTNPNSTYTYGQYYTLTKTTTTV